jgi:hypothetical protein
MAGAFHKANNRFQFAGHNIREFDIPYICRRLLINDMQLPNYMQLHGAKPWEIDMIDTLQWWKFGEKPIYLQPVNWYSMISEKELKKLVR